MRRFDSPEVSPGSQPGNLSLPWRGRPRSQGFAGPWVLYIIVSSESQVLKNMSKIHEHPLNPKSKTLQNPFMITHALLYIYILAGSPLAFSEGVTGQTWYLGLLAKNGLQRPAPKSCGSRMEKNHGNIWKSNYFLCRDLFWDLPLQTEHH